MRVSEKEECQRKQERTEKVYVYKGKRKLEREEDYKKVCVCARICKRVNMNVLVNVGVGV